MIRNLRYLLGTLILILSSSAFAQSTLDVPKTDRTAQLNIVQSVLDAKLNERKALRQRLDSASPDDIAELEVELKEINSSITEIRSSFEQIAVGSIDLALFNGEPTEFDWRIEMTQVMMPIIRNLQSLTEKPRKIEALRTQILQNNERLVETNTALVAISESIASVENEATRRSLLLLQTTWSDQAQEITRSTDIAKVKLRNLQQNDKNIIQTVIAGVVGFIKGRGLTLTIAIAVALAVWYASKLATKLLLTKSRKEGAKSYRTRQRLVQYGFKLLSALLVAIAVIVVFYVRGDVLMLGVAFLIAGAALLGLRHAVPRFISEAKLLLNLGSIREDERVVYNGLPFQVTSLNMYSILKNPELTGVIRLPLESMMGMISRPAGKEVWFPASKGDFIMLPDGKLLEVIALTTELIQLQSLAGTKTSVPAAEFYNMTFDNLSRGEHYSIVGTFGVGYSHQSISNDGIPTALQKAVAGALAKTDFSRHVVSVAVELKEAGASSLDYWVCVTMSSEAVRSYYKINRIVQQTCVATCTAENWDIPFPQLTIHNQ